MVPSRSSPEIILLLNIFLGRKKGATDRIGAPFVVVITINENNDCFCFCQGIYYHKSFINKYLLTICQVSLSYHIHPILRDIKFLGVVNDTLDNDPKGYYQSYAYCFGYINAMIQAVYG